MISRSVNLSFPSSGTTGSPRTRNRFRRIWRRKDRRHTALQSSGSALWLRRGLAAMLRVNPLENRAQTPSETTARSSRICKRYARCATDRSPWDHRSARRRDGDYGPCRLLFGRGHHQQRVLPGPYAIDRLTGQMRAGPTNGTNNGHRCGSDNLKKTVFWYGYDNLCF